MTSVAMPPLFAPAVTLRPLRVDDRERVRAWMSDHAVIDFTVQVPGPEFGPVFPYSADEADRYLEMLVRDPDRRSYAIELHGTHVGNVGLKAHDWRQRTAECFIEIGDLAARRRGVGHQAMGALLGIAFDECRLRRLRLGVFEFNAPAIALYRKLGFVDDGRHGSHYVRGRFWSVNAMALDEKAWRARQSSP
jgi:RimJ/RimL family protein N-acetyltransferase